MSRCIRFLSALASGTRWSRSLGPSPPSGSNEHVVLDRAGHDVAEGGGPERSQRLGVAAVEDEADLHAPIMPGTIALVGDAGARRATRQRRGQRVGEASGVEVGRPPQVDEVPEEGVAAVVDAQSRHGRSRAASVPKSRIEGEP